MKEKKEKTHEHKINAKHEIAKETTPQNKTKKQTPREKRTQKM